LQLYGRFALLLSSLFDPAHPSSPLRVKKEVWLRVKKEVWRKVKRGGYIVFMPSGDEARAKTIHEPVRLRSPFDSAHPSSPLRVKKEVWLRVKKGGWRKVKRGGYIVFMPSGDEARRETRHDRKRRTSCRAETRHERRRGTSGDEARRETRHHDAPSGRYANRP